MKVKKALVGAIVIAGAIAGLVAFRSAEGVIFGAIGAVVLLLFFYPMNSEHFEDSANRGYIEGDTVPLSRQPGADEEDGTGDGPIR